MDTEDSKDDLQQRELLLRIASIKTIGNQYLTRQILNRRLHKDDSEDEEEDLLLLWDEGYSELETVWERWKRLERRRVEWCRVATP
jgi:hypothetical protein